MKKAIFFTVFSWGIVLAGYAQTMRVPLPKGLQCNDIPTWPITHARKGNTDANANKTSSSATSQSNNSKPISTLPPLPLIKFWLATESNDSKAVD